MQKARFYGRMMIAGFIHRVLFAGHEINVSRSDYRCSGGRSFFVQISHRLHFPHGEEVRTMKILTWEARTEKGLTLMELAKKSGLGKSTLNNIENGKVSPTLFQLEMIAIALDVKITDLFESEYK